MKRTFLKFLPLVAAVVLAASCGDNDDDSNVISDPATPETQEVVTPDNDGVTIVPMTITVGKGGNSLSKATVEESDGSFTQKFIAGDVLVISNSDVLASEATFTLETGEGTANATFKGELSVKSGATLTKGTTTLNAVLKNTGSDESKQNNGVALTEIKEVSSLAEGFEKYGYLKADNFDYNGDETSIELVQNTVFLRIKPFYGTTSATINTQTYTASDGVIYLAVPSGTKLTSNLFSGEKTVTSDGGKVVKNIDRSSVREGALSGEFTVSPSGKKVHFSKGNLQATYNGSSWSWGFAANQWESIGQNAANTSINGNGSVSTNGTVDLFGWVGASSTVLTSAPAMYGISTSTTVSAYGNVNGESLKSDWGKVFGESSTWYTLSNAEWEYLLNTRSTTSNIRYAKATVNGVAGLIILPDDWNASTTFESTNVGTADFTVNTINDAAKWSEMESAGAVFLPAAGYRFGPSVYIAGTFGLYWSSTAYGTSDAYYLNFNSSYVYPSDNNGRYFGYSVRLVCASQD